MPEVLEAVLEQDPELKKTFNHLTLGKKRNLIHSINRIKDIDKQIQKVIQLIHDSNKTRPKRSI